jgi:hypothetical protein
MKPNYLFFVAILLILSSSCSNNGENLRKSDTIAIQGLLDSNYHKKNFDSLLAVVCKDTSGLDYSEELLASPSFRVIYEHSTAYLEDAIQVLSKEKFNTMQASVCIFAMQNLQVVDYVRFCRFYLALYDRKKIMEPMLQQAILPNFLESRIIPQNYKDSGVIVLLHEIKSNGNISKAFKTEIENVLSGKYIEEVNKNPSNKR